MIKRKTKIRPLAKDCENGSPEKMKNTIINSRVLLLARHLLYYQLHRILQLEHQCVSHVILTANAMSSIYVCTDRLLLVHCCPVSLSNKTQLR